MLYYLLVILVVIVIVVVALRLIGRYYAASRHPTPTASTERASS